MEKISLAAAFLFAALYLLGAAGIHIPGSGRTQTVPGQGAAFHSGKSGRAQVPDPGCQSPSCHVASPHGKDGSESAFRNMHQGFAECLGCHGKEPETRLFVESAGESWKIRYKRETMKGNQHVDLGKAATCRKCHSETGRARLQEMGLTGLRPGYSDPIALKMLEGGPKRWAPADLR